LLPKNKNNSRESQDLRVSQNFLTSRAVVERIVSLARLRREDHVVEIGPGKGHITRALLKRCGQVTAIELDPVLYEKLRETLGGADNLRLVQADFLRRPLPRGPYKVFANIPFNQTTAILRKLTQSSNPPDEIWLVVEKGAALRFIGRPRESLTSLNLKPWFEAELRYYFHRADFHPMPAAEAVLLHLTRKAAPDIPPARRAAYERFVRTRKGHATRDTLYIQWLCLFRRYWDRGGR